MLRISRLADYGVVLSTRLAAVPSSELRSVRELAAETGIPQPTVSKILKTLTRGDLVVSERGAHGGYRLARRPDDISVAEIVVVLEGPIGITECVREEDDASCEYLGRCDVHGNWQRINNVLDEALRGISLADMLQPVEPPLVTLGKSRPPTTDHRSDLG